MSGYSSNEKIYIAIAPVPSAVLSFVASATIVVMIIRSPTKLSNPFRRIIFGISIYDVVQSLSQASGTVLSPKGSMPGALGNDGTCTASGFVSYVSKVEREVHSNFVSRV